MSLSSFRDHTADRSGHLLWRDGDVHLLLGEDATGFYSHLPHENEYASDWRDHLDEELSSSDADHFRRHLNSLSGLHHNDIYNYKKSSDSINHPLRSGLMHRGKLLFTKVMPTNPDSVKSQQNNLDRYHRLDDVTSDVTPRDFTVYRGMSHGSGIHKIAPGGHFIDHGYTGTTFDKDIAHGFADSHVKSPWEHSADSKVPDVLNRHAMIAKIHVPAGSKGHFLDLRGGAGPLVHLPEKELLLHRGTKFRVLGHERVFRPGNPGTINHGVHMIHMRVVGNEPHELITHHQLGYDPDE